MELINQLVAELQTIIEERSCMLGVGDGSGNLFVRGDEASVKSAQKLIFERSVFIARINELRDDLKFIAEEMCCKSGAPMCCDTYVERARSALARDDDHSDDHEQIIWRHVK